MNKHATRGKGTSGATETQSRRCREHSRREAARTETGSERGRLSATGQWKEDRAFRRGEDNDASDETKHRNRRE